jgi:hypothetical protein
VYSVGAYAPDDQKRKGYMLAYKFAPDEILNSMFLSLVKKALMRGISGRRQVYALPRRQKI